MYKSPTFLLKCGPHRKKSKIEKNRFIRAFLECLFEQIFVKFSRSLIPELQASAKPRTKHCLYPLAVDACPSPPEFPTFRPPFAGGLPSRPRVFGQIGQFCPKIRDFWSKTTHFTPENRPFLSPRKSHFPVRLRQKSPYFRGSPAKTFS